MSGRKSKIIAGTVLLLLVMCFMVFLYRNSTRGQFESSLPSEYSSDVTMREIKEDVDDFCLDNDDIITVEGVFTKKIKSNVYYS